SPLPRAYTPSVLLTFTHPLLKGAGAAAARASQRRADAAREVAKAQRRAAAAEVLREVSRAYWELAYATSEAKIRKSSLGLAREQLRVVQENIAAGKQPASASAEVEVAVALREEEELLAEQELKVQSLELGRLLALEPIADGSIFAAAETPELVLCALDADRA